MKLYTFAVKDKIVRLRYLIHDKDSHSATCHMVAENQILSEAGNC